jgi:hypothetical protein
MKLTWRSMFVFPALGLLLTGCEVQKTANDMKHTTRRVEDSSKHLEKRTDDLHNDMTYKESDETMTKRLAMIFGDTAEENVGVVQNAWNYFFGLSNEPDLFKFAGVTMLAMHWQFWKGDYNDNMKELDSRMYWAAESLFLGTFKHTPRDGDVDVFRPDRSFRGVAALGAKLDMVSDRMHDVLSAHGLPDSVFYDMIVTALRNRNSFTRTEQFPRATEKVLQWEPEATYMLQLRHNIYPVMVVTRITDFVERGDVRRLLMAKTGQKVDIKKFNPEMLKEWTSWLEKASKTRADLLSAKIEPQYNRMLADIVAGVDFGQKEILARAPGLIADERGQLEYRFARAYQKAVSESAPQKR